MIAHIDPQSWASAALTLLHEYRWEAIVVLLVFIVCRWPPWRSSVSDKDV